MMSSIPTDPPFIATARPHAYTSESLVTGLALCHDPGKIEHFGNPPAIVFLLYFNAKAHDGIIHTRRLDTEHATPSCSRVHATGDLNGARTDGQPRRDAVKSIWGHPGCFGVIQEKSDGRSRVGFSRPVFATNFSWWSADSSCYASAGFSRACGIWLTEGGAISCSVEAGNPG